MYMTCTLVYIVMYMVHGFNVTRPVVDFKLKRYLLFLVHEK